MSDRGTRILRVWLPAALLLAMVLGGCGKSGETGETAWREAAVSESFPEPGSSVGSAETPEPTETPGPTGTPEPTPVLADVMETVPAGTVVDETDVDRSTLDRYFQAYEISDTLFERIYGDDRSYKTYCTVPREDLRYIKVLHYGYDGQIHVGELMVNALLAEDMKAIFRTLFENGYPIEKMFLVDDYGADDDRSINDNNTSAFNFRLASNAENLSNHAAGCAIDINPKQNPYFLIQPDGSVIWENEDAELYLDRDVPDAAERHMITRGDLCYQLFTRYGYTWGGDWNNPVDYQHFEKVVYIARMPDTEVSE